MITRSTKNIVKRSKILREMFQKTTKIPAKEYFDSEEDFERHVDVVSDLLTSSGDNLIFCGAGLSTPSGIPDYRSGYETVLKTGPGKWEREKEGNKPYEKPAEKRLSVEAWPNDGHLALKAMEESGLIRSIISQNVDGLLTRAHFPSEKKIELHGNVYKERCVECGKVFWRDFPTIKKNQRRITERKCDCSKNSDIRVSLVYFGDSLYPDDMEDSYEVVLDSNFCLAVGSSLQVTPASNFVRDFIRKDKRVAIVNLQRTIMHSNKTINVHSYTDKFLKAVAENIGLKLPKRELWRDIRVEKIDGPKDYQIQCFDYEGKRLDGLKSVKFMKRKNTEEDALSIKDCYQHRILENEIKGKFRIMRVNLYMDDAGRDIDLDLDKMIDGGYTARVFYSYDCNTGASFERIEYH